MSLKKLGVVLLVVVALGAIAANNAIGASGFEESGGTWFVGGTKLAEGTHETLKSESVGTGKIETTIAGQEIDITAKLTCLGCFIDNTAGTVAQTVLVLSLTEV